MKNILSSSLFLTLMLINYSCAQDLKPLDEEPDNSILKTEINYEMELVFDDENIIWGIEFLSDNSILASIKSGSLIHFKEGKKTQINGLPEIYFRGQGGLLDIALHPDFDQNRWLYLSYSYEENKGDGGNTTIARAKLIDDSLQDLEILYFYVLSDDYLMLVILFLVLVLVQGS